MIARRKLWLPLLLAVSLLYYGGGSVMAESYPEQITLSWTEWTQLKTELTAQAADLELLQSKLETLRKNSSGQTQTLLELQEQLNSSRTQLQKVKESLTNAQTSLNDAKRELDQSRTSLQELKTEVKEMEREQSRLQRQRDTCALLAALAIGVALTK